MSTLFLQRALSPRTLLGLGFFLVFFYLESRLFCEVVTGRTPNANTAAINANPEEPLQIYSLRRQHTAKLITCRTHPETS